MLNIDPPPETDDVKELRQWCQALWSVLQESDPLKMWDSGSYTDSILPCGRRIVDISR